MDKNVKRHYNSIDYLRIISALAVIMIHAVSSELSKGSGVYDIGTVQVLERIHALLNWSVPIFFMITGFVFLSSDKKYTYQKMKKPIVRIVAAIVLVGAMYSFMERVYIVKGISLKLFLDILKDIISGNLWEHMWYLYAILAIYAVIPVLKAFFDNSSRKDIRTFTFVCYISTIIIPVLSKLLNIDIAIYISISGYITYVLLGGYIGKVIGTILKNKIKIRCISLLVYAVSVIYVIVSNDKVEYLSFVASVMAISLFLIAITFDSIKSTKVLRSMAVATYGIYLIHPLFINIQMEILYLSPIKKWLAFFIPINVVVVFLISYITVFFIQEKFINTFIFRKQIN